MKDLFSLKLDAVRVPVEKTIELDGDQYIAHFLPLMRSEFAAIQKKDNADDHLIFQSWVHPDGSKRLQSPDAAGEFPVKAYNALVTAALEASGFGKRAHDEAKKD
jgi:hypothetical protein